MFIDELFLPGYQDFSEKDMERDLKLYVAAMGELMRIETDYETVLNNLDRLTPAPKREEYSSMPLVARAWNTLKLINSKHTQYDVEKKEFIWLG